MQSDHQLSSNTHSDPPDLSQTPATRYYTYQTFDATSEVIVLDHRETS